MITFTSFDGHALSQAGGYHCIQDGDAGDGPRRVALDLRPRGMAAPRVAGRERKERSLPFSIYNQGIAAATFTRNVEEWFRPEAGARTLLAETPDGVAVQALADVTELEWDGEFRYRGTFLLPDRMWRAQAAQTIAASPGTVQGRHRALGTATITPSGGTRRRRRITITDTTGYGLADTLVEIALDSTGASLGNGDTHKSRTYVNGIIVPTYWLGPNSSTGSLYVQVNVPPLGTTAIDVYYGADVDGTGASHALDPGGRALSDASYGNTLIIWDDWRVGRFPETTGVWRLANLGQRFSGVSWGISSQTTASIQFEVRAGAVLRENADSVVCTFPSPAAASNALANMAITLGAPSSGTFQFAQAFLRYRTRGDTEWTQANAVTFASSMTMPQSIPAAIEVAIGLEPITDQANARLTIGPLSGTQARVTLAGGPTVNVGSAVTARQLSGALAVGGVTVTFPPTLLDDVALIIETDPILGTPSVRTADGSPFYGLPQFSDAVDLLPLPVGAGLAFSGPTGGSTAFSYRPQYPV